MRLTELSPFAGRTCLWFMVFNATLSFLVLPECRWFSPGSPVSSINKTDRHDICNIVESGVKHHKP
jgi:hypothetical protein